MWLLPASASRTIVTPGESDGLIVEHNCQPVVLTSPSSLVSIQFQDLVLSTDMDLIDVRTCFVSVVPRSNCCLTSCHLSVISPRSENQRMFGIASCNFAALALQAQLLVGAWRRHLIPFCPCVKLQSSVISASFGRYRDFSGAVLSPILLPKTSNTNAWTTEVFTILVSEHRRLLTRNITAGSHSY